MLAGELRGKVGVAPGTTTIQILGNATLSPEQHAAEDIRLREQQLLVRRKEAKWTGIAAIASAALTSLAVIAAVGAWVRTGRLQAPKGA